jgi:hypothetical protein
MRLNKSESLLTTRDGILLQNIHIRRQYIEKPFLHTKRSFEKGMLPQEVAEVILDDLSSNPQILNFEIVENAPAEIAENPGFRFVFTHQSKDGLRFKSVFYGFMANEWVYTIEYTAPQRYYFDKDLETFEKVVKSFRLIQAA